MEKRFTCLEMFEKCHLVGVLNFPFILCNLYPKTYFTFVIIEFSKIGVKYCDEPLDRLERKFCNLVFAVISYLMFLLYIYS